MSEGGVKTHLNAPGRQIADMSGLLDTFLLFCLFYNNNLHNYVFLRHNTDCIQEGGRTTASMVQYPRTDSKPKQDKINYSGLQESAQSLLTLYWK